MGDPLRSRKLIEEGGRGGRDGKLGDDFEKRKMEKLFPFTTGNAARFSPLASSELQSLQIDAPVMYSGFDIQIRYFEIHLTPLH